MSSNRPEIDTRRPFNSVKEAVAVFGQRLLSGETNSQYSPPSPSYSTSSSKFNQDRGEDLSIIMNSMKKLETEVALLKQRGSETEIAVTALIAELHEKEAKQSDLKVASDRWEQSDLKLASDRWGIEEDGEIMEVKYDGDEFNGRGVEVMKKKMKKKKPIVPLIGDLFSRKKGFY